MYVRVGRPAFARPYVGVHRSTSLMSSSLLLQQWPACLVRITPSISLSFRFLWFLISGPLGWQSPLFGRFSFFLLGLVFYLLLGLVFWLMFCLYVKFPEGFMCFVILDGFWFVYKLYGSILKFQFLAQLPLDHHSHPIASSLIVIIIIMSCR